MSGDTGFGLGSKTLAEKIKSFSKLPDDGCPAGDHSIREVVSLPQKKERKDSALLVGHCPLSEVELLAK